MPVVMVADLYSVVKTLVEALRELTVAIKAQTKPHKHTGGHCEFCKAPSIEAKFRLMEAAYHEDMAEVYTRLAKLEAKCLKP
jgi:hypothetical protein